MFERKLVSLIMMKIKPNFQHADHFKNFWTKGNGRQLVDWTYAQLSFDDFERFAPLYYKVDELGDNVVKEVYLTQSFSKASQQINEYIINGVDQNDPSVPNSIKRLFTQIDEIPDWLDWNLIETGAELCRKSGLNSLISLRDYSLMGGYDFGYLNKPLIFTGALKRGAVKRLADTLDFWVNVTRKNALQKPHKGYELCIKTRLIHSYSRLMILEKRKDWDTEKWGLPINTWDMCATYIGFSLVFLHGLKKLGITISPEEEKGHFHLWKYIGNLIGIPSEFLPNSKKEATEHFYLWTSIQPPSDKDSALLAKSLLDENLESTILKYQFQRKNLRYLHIAMNWYLLDPEVNERLQIPRIPLKKVFPTFLKSQNKIFQTIFSRKRQIEIGGKAQEKVLEDYLRTAPRNVHH